MALSGFQQMSNSIILSGVMSTFSLFTTNDIYCHWQRIVETLILWHCNFYPAYSGWESRGGGDSYMEQTGMLVENFEFNP